MPDKALKIDLEYVDNVLSGIVLGNRVSLTYRKSRALWGGEDTK